MESLRLYNRAIQLLYQRLYDPEMHTTEDMLWSMCGFLTHDVSFDIVQRSHYNAPYLKV
jgi:hypothetical protein